MVVIGLDDVVNVFISIGIHIINASYIFGHLVLVKFDVIAKIFLEKFNLHYLIVKMEQKKQTFIFSICDALRKYNLTKEVRIFIACQFALESNFGTSQLARNRNNFCGMRTPLVRISSANNAGKPNEAFASYSSLENCVDDYILCIQYHRPLSTNYDTIQHYTQFIHKFYCPEKDYIERIDKIVKDFLNIKTITL